MLSLNRKRGHVAIVILAKARIQLTTLLIVIRNYRIDWVPAFAGTTERDYLMARKPSKLTYFIMVMTSVKPARSSSPRLPAVENGLSTPSQTDFLVQDFIRTEAVALFEFPV